MPGLEYCVVDAFTHSPFQGNPAAVVHGGDDLTDAAKQRIAAEFNLSETVFILRPTAHLTQPTVRLRWFTPQCEVSFCGHATLAAVHVFCESSGGTSMQLNVECAAGNLVVKIEPVSARGQRYWLAMPPAELREADVPRDRLDAALRLPAGEHQVCPLVRTRDNDLILLLSAGRTVTELVPDMAALERLSREHGIRGVSVASPDSGGPQIACISRFFAPAAGIGEDPVTGSVHGPLATLLIRNGVVPPTEPDRWSFCCRQLPANGRVGTIDVRAESRGEELAVEVGGACVTVMKGQLSI